MSLVRLHVRLLLLLVCVFWFVPVARANEKPLDDKPDEALVAARHLLLTGKYAEATEAYDKLVEMHPVVAALGLARCQAAVGEYDKALETLAGAAEKHPDATLEAERARLAFAGGDYHTADQAVDAALKIDDKNVIARWIAAERHRVEGRLDEAAEAYDWFVDYYNDHEVDDPEVVRIVGLAAAQNARWQRTSEDFDALVNDLYPSALDLDEDYWPAHYEAGMLFLEKFNEAEANRELKAALAINPNAAEAHAAQARLALQNYDLDDARRWIDRALEINPHLFTARLYEADLQLANFQIDEAVATLEKALKLNPQSEQAQGRLAAAYAGLDGWPSKPADSRFNKLVSEVNEHNPHAGEFYFALASALDLTRRFPAAARYYKEAVERMPEMIEPRGALGLMYLRLGEETEARKLLDESFETDPFNVRVSNSLKVLEVLDNYAVLETPHFVIKFDRGKDEILAKYAARYLEDEVYPALVKQFHFAPPGKSLFEIFQRARNTSGHGWFSARMVGLPYVGTVGACAGKMVALASPNDMQEKYNWARVLKHEFVHVLNLQQTNFNIPHWYTEALAVENEGYPRPQQWNELLLDRTTKGKLFNLDNLNLAFVRPHSSDDWTMAYCQAQLYAQYMLKKYGPDALAKMLAGYADNLSTRAALKREFGVEQEDFEKGYLEFVKQIVAGLASAGERGDEKSFAELQRAQQAQPDDPQLMAQLALAYLNRKDYPEARKLSQAALKKQPKLQLAGYVLARVRLVIGEDDEAIRILEECLDRQAPEEHLLHLLAGLKMKQEDYAGATELYELGADRFPQDPQWTKSLVRLYLKSGEKKELVPLLAKLADSDADDLTVRKKLAQLALDAKDYAAAVRWSQDALHVDVLDPEVHQVLAQALVEMQKYSTAIEEFLVTIKLEPKEPGLRLALADAYIQAKQLDKARAALKALLEIDPEFPGARLMLESLEEK